MPRYRVNTLVRLFFLFLTPVLFRWINPGFVWHSIFYGSVTVVLLLWGAAVALSPVFGRVVCGWICPFGTVQDLVASVRVGEPRRDHPLRVTRWILLASFLVTAFVLGPIGRDGSLLSGWSFSPYRLDVEFTTHYKHVWMYDTVGIMLLALVLGRRGVCRYSCSFGAACAIGALWSRLRPIVTERCNGCGKCDRVCPARVELTRSRQPGFASDPECLLCGLCADVCPRKAIRFRFQWRSRQARRASSPSPLVATPARTMRR